MLRAIYSSLLASLAPLEQIRNQGTDARGIRKKDHRRHSESCFCTSERNKPCPLSSLKLFFTKPPRICQDSRARPGCRKRKCRSVDVVSHLAACAILPKFAFLPCARCEVRRSHLDVFLHVPHTHRGDGWLPSLSMAILRVRSRVTEYG